jgi:DNA-directed RNA polymerase specialized sigma24 family protein
MSAFPSDPLNPLFQDYLSAWQAVQLQPDDATLQPLLDQQSNALWIASYPVLYRLARSAMKSGKAGRDFNSAEDLAHAVLEKLFSHHPHLKINLEAFDFETGSITAYLSQIIQNAYLDDLRRLTGRGQGIIRIYVPVDDPVLFNELSSDRRTQSGYYALKQTRHHLDIYLRQIPGSIVQIPTGGKMPGIRTARLTKGHADLLRQWMAGEDNLSWEELATTMERPVGTVKRWFIETKRHFITDPSPDAVALRSLFGVQQLTVTEEEEQESQDESQLDG